MTYKQIMDGLAIGTDKAIEMLETDVREAAEHSSIDPEMYERMLNRVRWLANRIEPIKPKFIKGKYGKQYDVYTCGSCGHTVGIGIDKYCPNCGRMVGWKNVHEQTSASTAMTSAAASEARS